MKKSHYRRKQLLIMRLHLLEGLVRVKCESGKILEAFGKGDKKKDILVKQFKFSPVQADCILDLKVPINELEENRFLETINEINAKLRRLLYIKIGICVTLSISITSLLLYYFLK